MARPNWEYIRVDVLLPDNPKLDGLSAAAKWTLIELWCYCGQHLTDGFVRDAKWQKFGTRRDRDALVGARLAEPVPGGYQMHDFIGEDGHQRSRAEVLALKAKRAESGRKGGNAKARAVANAKQVLEQTPEHVLYQNSGKSVAEAEAEAEADKSLADVDDQSNGRYARDGDDLIDLIITELRSATGRTVDQPWAAKTRDYILSGRKVADPAAYIRQVIRSEPDPRTRFLPLYPS